MPTVEGLQFAYALYALPPGRLPFGRWRWELSRPQAGRALRVHAAEFGHRLFGLPVPERHPATGAGDLRPGVAERLAIGSITYMLVPRALDASAAATGALQ